MNNVAIILISATFAAVGQVLWKVGTNQVGLLTALDFDALSSVLLNPYVMLGCAMYGIGTIFWLLALSRMELSFVYPFIFLNYILVLGLSHLVFRECIGLNKIAGSVLIILRLIFISKFY